MTKRRLSVIILTKDSAATIGKCLESVIDQSILPNEIIVIDGGSKDGTLALLRRFPVRVYRESSRSIGHARNLGVKKAEGEIVFFIDSDCYAERDWVKNMLPHFDQPGVAGVAGRIVRWDPESVLARYQSAFMTPPENRTLVRRVPMCNTALRKEAILSVGGFDETLAWSEDLDLLHRITRNHPIVYENEAVVHHKVPETFSEFFRKRVQAAISGGELFAKYGFEFGVPRSFTYSAGFLLCTTILIFTALYHPPLLGPLVSLAFLLTALQILRLYSKSREKAVVLFPIVALVLCIAYLNFFRGLAGRLLQKPE